MNSVITIIDGEQSVDLVDMPEMLDPLVADGLIASWRVSASVQGVTLILPRASTSEQRRALIDLIKAQGLRTIEED